MKAKLKNKNVYYIVNVEYMPLYKRSNDWHFINLTIFKLLNDCYLRLRLPFNSKR